MSAEVTPDITREVTLPAPSRLVRVVVADDHPVFRSGLRTLVEESGRLALVGEAADGEEAVAVCLAQRPEVVLMDVRMPGMSGVDATRRILAEAPQVRVVVLTMLEDDTSLLACLRAGARGYVLKGAGPDEIVDTVLAVAAGRAVFGPQIAARLGRLVAAGGGPPPHPFPDLTARERDVLDLLAAGHPNHVIAHRLALSEKTVRNNVSAIFAKLGTADRAAAVVRAREAGLGTAGTAVPADGVQTRSTAPCTARP
jgi:DNA-binding NarL/FixJ family response regulator